MTQEVEKDKNVAKRSWDSDGGRSSDPVDDRKKRSTFARFKTQLMNDQESKELANHPDNQASPRDQLVKLYSEKLKDELMRSHLPSSRLHYGGFLNRMAAEKKKRMRKRDDYDDEDDSDSESDSDSDESESDESDSDESSNSDESNSDSNESESSEEEKRNVRRKKRLVVKRKQQRKL